MLMKRGSVSGLSSSSIETVLVRSNLQRAVLPLALLGISCAATTYNAMTYRQAVITQLEIRANVPAEARARDRVGTSPVSFPFKDEEEVNRQVKTTNYWEANPGTLF